MRIEPCPVCGKPIDVDDDCRHLPDPPDLPDSGLSFTSVWNSPSPDELDRLAPHWVASDPA